jgi:hypothetical protein
MTLEITLALIIGMALAFIAGMMMPSNGPPEEPPEPPHQGWGKKK